MDIKKYYRPAIDYALLRTIPIYLAGVEGTAFTLRIASEIAGKLSETQNLPSRIYSFLTDCHDQFKDFSERLDSNVISPDLERRIRNA